MKLIIKYDGVGLPKEFKLECSRTLGLQLVHSLVQQLDGYVEIKINKGTEFEISFKELKYEE